MHHFGLLQLAAQLPRHGLHDRFEHLGDPQVRAQFLVHVRVVVRPVGVHVVEQPAGLVLLGIQAGQAQQPALVVAGVDHFGLQLDLGAVRRWS